MKVLVSGATGYIGGRLVPRLLERGVDVRCMTRDPRRLSLDPWRDQVEVVAADARRAETLRAALEGCDAAYYLIHSMEAAGTYAEQDREAARNFRDAAAAAGVKRIVYLGGLGSDELAVSGHLRSRHEVGRILASGPTPVTELRAAVIIGSGSVSFEIIRHLTEVLPIMMRPRWVRTRCQPIAVRNVLEILVAVFEDEEPVDRQFEIGGPDVLTYEEMIQTYASVAGLPRRRVIPLPLFSAWLSPIVVGLLTPLPVRLVRPLIESLMDEVVVSRPMPQNFRPEAPISYRHAVELALRRIEDFAVESRWSDALTQPALPSPSDPEWAGEVKEIDRKAVRTTASAEDLFWAVSRIGGEVGYYRMNWAWQVRGWFDELIGGVGLRRGRRHPEELRPGESLDFWRVAVVEPNRRLLLRAEMKVPGSAWLEWRIEPAGAANELVQIAWFVPRGLFGRIYWWGLLPIHAPIFGTMARRIARTAETRWDQRRPASAAARRSRRSRPERESTSRTLSPGASRRAPG